MRVGERLSARVQTCDERGTGQPQSAEDDPPQLAYHELWYSYPYYPCPNKMYNTQLWHIIIQFCYTNWVGRGHGYKCHRSYNPWIITGGRSASRSQQSAILKRATSTSWNPKPQIHIVCTQLLLCVIDSARATYDARCFSWGFYLTGKGTGQMRFVKGILPFGELYAHKMQLGIIWHVPFVHQRDIMSNLAPVVSLQPAKRSIWLFSCLIN